MNVTRAPDTSLKNAKFFIGQIYETGDSRPSHATGKCSHPKSEAHTHTHDETTIPKAKTPNSPEAYDLSDIPVDFSAPINIHGLAKLVKNA
jgi:hypothetical protein